MGKELLLVGVGGMAGSISRYLVFKLSSAFVVSWFPFSTFIVNIVGSLLIGILYALAERSAGLSVTIRPLLMAGFCGGFTTFSAISLENYQLLKNGDYLALAGYTFASMVIGLGAVVFGVRIVGAFAE